MINLLLTASLEAFSYNDFFTKAIISLYFFYIGKTHRHLSVQAKEHTDLVLGNTVVTNHIRSCDGCQSRNLVFKNRTFENFEIISKCNTKFECIIKEALFIKKFNPPLNKQTQNSGSSFLLNIF